ncbi:unnamed protein product [Adineta steineri]|uniref:Uncharacterized protein n=1 Tax=Adineta steineri TaxID=433720 RepID=A0A819QVV0_9BILA|nr:unnamed protein product [Adineta steineri]CAF3994488.1 unnamed protein product [Adineta steineri]CAF4037228.1 unnamed protein product [Adineta steineri]
MMKSLILIAITIIAGTMAMSIKTDDDSCPFPSQLKPKYDFSWKSKSGEWQNLTATTAYMMLALSWSPTYCATLSQANRDKEFQCMPSNGFGLIVHGLWPQAAKAPNVRAHPRNCRDEAQLNATFVKRFFCIMPSEDLMQGEWEKHGTCYYNQPMDYYMITEKIYQALRIPTNNVMTSSSAVVIKDAFLTLNSPALFASAVQIDMSGSKLKEVKICYDLQFRYASCT